MANLQHIWTVLTLRSRHVPVLFQVVLLFRSLTFGMCIHDSGILRFTYIRVLGIRRTTIPYDVVGLLVDGRERSVEDHVGPFSSRGTRTCTVLWDLALHLQLDSIDSCLNFGNGPRLPDFLQMKLRWAAACHSQGLPSFKLIEFRCRAMFSR